MTKLLTRINSINRVVGNVFSWCTLGLVVALFVDVLLRYVFKFSLIWLSEVEVYLFALVFLAGIGYTLQHDQHVRVDVFYEHWSTRRKAWVNLIGTIIFLVPWCIVSILAAWKYASFSLNFMESSPQPGGLPYLFVLKFLIVIGFVLLLIQGIGLALESIQILLSRNEKQEN